MGRSGGGGGGGVWSAGNMNKKTVDFLLTK